AVPPAVQLTDVTEGAGIQFHHTSSRSGRFYLPETLGSGCAFLDYNHDGKLDLFFVNSSRLPGFQGGGPFYSALYRNNGNGTFTDGTRKAGLTNSAGEALGVVVWDYDGDGWPDLAVAQDMEPNLLYRNNHDGTFSERGVEAGLAFSKEGKSRAGMGIDTADAA